MSIARSLGTLLAVVLLGLLVLPIVALALSASPSELVAGLSHPSFLPALKISLGTSVISLLVLVVAGAPLAWWLATSSSRYRRLVEILVEIPIVVPPAVVGVALLQTWGRKGLFGPLLEAAGLELSLTFGAVVMAQVVVAAPFFVQAAANAFRKVDPELIVVARTLGASPTRAFFVIVLPIALPGLVVGASLAWARALGEFGATLLFAGNLEGVTQTMPLAIFQALESDIRLAIALSLVLTAVGALLLLGLRLGPSMRGRLRGVVEAGAQQ